jgi:hypothetical protein
VSLDGESLLGLYERSLQAWSSGASDPERPTSSLQDLLLAVHQANYRIWKLEDEARRTDVPDAHIAQVKRQIDQWNQRRCDLVESVDDRFLAEAGALPRPDAEQHSETVGMIVDRLSILALKVHHAALYATRASDPALRAECERRRKILVEQREDLCRCLDRLLADIRSGRRYFKAYRQLKAYNDPRLRNAGG